MPACHDCRELRRHLNNLTITVQRVIAALDEEMRKPSTVERGQRIAQISNALELQNDLAIRFGLKKTQRLSRRKL